MIHGIKRQFEEITGKEARSIIEIKEGITNENYLINDAYVLRIPQKDHDPTINLKTKYIQKLNPYIFQKRLSILTQKQVLNSLNSFIKLGFMLSPRQMNKSAMFLKRLKNYTIKISKFQKNITLSIN